MRELKRPASERGARSRGAQGETARKIKVWFPAWAAAKRPDRFTLLLAALAVLGAVLILARQVTYGVGLSADFVAYLSTARSLLAGEGFIQIHGWPYLHWPPLYPMRPTDTPPSPRTLAIACGPTCTVRTQTVRQSER